jgi:hypothetical protein
MTASAISEPGPAVSRDLSEARSAAGLERSGQPRRGRRGVAPRQRSRCRRSDTRPPANRHKRARSASQTDRSDRCRCANCRSGSCKHRSGHAVTTPSTRRLSLQASSGSAHRAPCGRSAPGGSVSHQPKRYLCKSTVVAAAVRAPHTAIRMSAQRTMERSRHRPREGRCNPLCMTLLVIADRRSRCLAFTRVGLRETKATATQRIPRRWRRSSR